MIAHRYVGEDEPLPPTENFMEGFAIHGQLTDLEAECIPDLINLRIASNAVYFTGEWGFALLLMRCTSRVNWACLA